MEENLMLYFINERTTDFFYNLNMKRISIAFNIKSYLDPDIDSVPPVGPIYNLFLSEEFEMAIFLIFEKLNLNLNGYWAQKLKEEAIEFAKILLNKYRKNNK